MSVNATFSHSFYPAVSDFKSMSLALCQVGGYLFNDEQEIIGEKKNFFIIII